MLESLKAPRPAALAALLRDRRGGVALIVVGLLPVLVGIAGLSVDMGRAYIAKRQLQDVTQAAALAGANAFGQVGASASMVSSAVAAWTTAHAPAGINVTDTTTSLACVSTVADLPACNDQAPNVVRVTQAASVPTHFLKVIGKDVLTLRTSVSAAVSGGSPKKLNVMFVLDVTGSMATPDYSCFVSGFSPTSKIQCAAYAIQNMLRGFPADFVNVGLMIFPGMKEQWTLSASSCGSQPGLAPYLSPGIRYQIGTTLEKDYNNGAGKLSSASTIVQAIGDYSDKPARVPCVQKADGGDPKLRIGKFITGGIEDGLSFGAEAISKAHEALPVVAGVQNIIIFISDGNYYTSWSGALSERTEKVSNQCQQAIDAASAATKAGTTVYSVAWGASTEHWSCKLDKDPAMTGCSTMKGIASDPAKFFTTSRDCTVSGSANSIDQLSVLLGNLNKSLSKPRIVLE